MGFDLVGVNPENKTGEYFRNNVWNWRPLWIYICDNCCDFMSEEQREAGNWNDGYKINKTTTKKIVARLETQIESGNTKRYEIEYKANNDTLLDEICKMCKGAGQRDDEHIKGECNGCKGTGKVRPFVTFYPFSEKNVKAFVAFAKASGGFKIY